MIEAVVTEHVNAPADRVRELYRDADNWARIFPATIRSARSFAGKETRRWLRLITSRARS